jgi:hypothetical protein
MRKLAFASIAIALCAAAGFAETHLSGDIKLPSLDSTGNPYIVDQDIVVPAGKKVVIKEGCVFLFKGFTGLNVFGQVHVAGSTKHPVSFTSVNDGDFNPKSDQLPNPFDWNGVLVAKESSGALFENFNLRYSVYGIKAQTTTISIQNGVFRQNGQFHFTINEKIQYVQDNIAYSYTATSSDAEKPAVSGTTETGTKTAMSKPAKSGKNVVAFRYTALGVGIVGLTAGSVMLIPWNNSKSQVLLSNTEFEAKYPNNTNEKWLQFVNSTNGWGAASIGCYALGLLGLIGFGVSFAF